jgi:hypothetical protein
MPGGALADNIRAVANTDNATADAQMSGPPTPNRGGSSRRISGKQTTRPGRQPPRRTRVDRRGIRPAQGLSLFGFVSCVAPPASRFQTGFPCSVFLPCLLPPTLKGWWEAGRGLLILLPACLPISSRKQGPALWFRCDRPLQTHPRANGGPGRPVRTGPPSKRPRRF